MLTAPRPWRRAVRPPVLWLHQNPCGAGPQRRPRRRSRRCEISRLGRWGFIRQLPLQWTRAQLLAKLVGKALVLDGAPVDFITIVVVVRKGSVNIGKRKARILRENLVGGVARLGKGCYVPHSDARAGD